MAFAKTFSRSSREGTFLVTACQSLDGLEVMFDDERAVANAGLILPATAGCPSRVGSGWRRADLAAGPGCVSAGPQGDDVGALDGRGR